ncbi:hypothetical protein KSF78_0008629 [Schistosoma japonicum]|nr:hypothetical protein KSF78_0008629 [Schistosoma japonicum]
MPSNISSGETIPTTTPPTTTISTTTSRLVTTVASSSSVALPTTTTTKITASSSNTTSTIGYDDVPTYSFVEFSLATRPTTIVMPIAQPLVSTKFNIQSTLYNQVNNTPVEWIEEYSDTNSPGYTNLKSKYCDLLLYYLQQAENSATNGANCEKVTFTPVTTTRPDGTAVRTVSGNTLINVPTTSGTQLTGSQLYGLFLNGYNKTNTSPSSIKLDAVNVQRSSGAVTCSQVTNPCGEHATCRDSPPGISCFCNSMWQDMNPKDPGKQCSLHPAAIALIALASLLLLAALILLLICLLRRRRRRRNSILASTDLATLNRTKQKKSWRTSLKNSLQTDELNPPTIPRASLTPTSTPNNIFNFSQIPPSPVPPTGLSMPLAPLGSNMIGGSLPTIGNTLPLTATALPLTTARGSMPSNSISDFQQIPASPARQTGLPIPTTPIGSNMIGGFPQFTGTALPLAASALPLAATRGSMPSNMFSGFQRNPSLLNPPTIPRASLTPTSTPNNIFNFSQIPPSSFPQTSLPTSLTPNRGNITGNLPQMIAPPAAMTGTTLPLATSNTMERIVTTPRGVPRSASRIPASPYAMPGSSIPLTTNNNTIDRMMMNRRDMPRLSSAIPDSQTSMPSTSMPLTSNNNTIDRMMMNPRDMPRLSSNIPESQTVIPGTTLPMTTTNTFGRMITPQDMSNVASVMPTSQIPSINMQMPKSPIITNIPSNLSEGLPQLPTNQIPSINMQMPKSPIITNISSNLSGGLPQLPTNQIPSINMQMPKSPIITNISSNLSGGLPQLPTNQIPSINMQMPKSPIITNIPSNLSGGLPQLPTNQSIKFSESINQFK